MISTLRQQHHLVHMHNLIQSSFAISINVKINPTTGLDRP